jgi:integrase
MSTIRQAQHWLIESKHLSGVEPIELTLRAVESERSYCYKAEEVAAMITHCGIKSTLAWLMNVITISATTGMRISEIASLKWSDVDFNNGRLLLSDETGHSRRKQQRRQIKSGRSRAIPIHMDLAGVLNGLPRKDAYVFHGPRGGRLKPDTVRNCLVRDVLEPLADRFPAAEGGKGFIHGRLHSFRHYFCSACANSGVAERVTMEWLGHADSAMVRHYYHLHDEEGQRQMRRLNLLGKTGEQHAGVQGAAIKSKEVSSQGSDPTIAS